MRRVLVRYENQYIARTQTDFESLDSALNGDSLIEAISGAWEKSIPDSEDFLGELQTVLADPFQDLSSAQDRLTDELSTPCKIGEDADSDGRAACRNHAHEQQRALLGALRDVHRFHDVLIERVRNEHLTQPTNEALEGKRNELAESNGVLTSEKSRLDILEGRLSKAREDFAADETPENQDALNREQRDFDEQVEKMEGAAAAVADVERDVADAVDALARARRNERTAKAAATRIVRDLILNVAQNRREAANTFETSVTFIGEASN